MAQGKDRDGLEIAPGMGLAGLQVDSLRFYRRFDGGGDGEEETTEFSLRDILYVLFRHKKKIIFCFLFLSFLTIIYVTGVRDTYLSEASVLIRRDRQSLTVDPMGGDGAYLKDAPTNPDMIRGEIAIFQSNDLAGKVVDKLGPRVILGPVRAEPQSEDGLAVKVGRAISATLKALNLTLPPVSERDRALASIEKHLTLKNFMSSGTVMMVEYSSYSPESAQLILNELLAAYQQKHIEVNKSQVPPGFFKARSEEVHSVLVEREKELEDLKRQLNITSPESEIEILLARLSTQESLAQTAEVAISTSRAMIESLESSRANFSKTIGGGKALAAPSAVDGSLRMRLLDLKIKEKELASRFTDSNPELIAVRTQISETEKMLVEQASGEAPLIPEVANPNYQNLEMRLDSEKAQLKAQLAGLEKLQSEILKTKTDIAHFMSNQQALLTLTKEVEKLRQQYNQYVNTEQIADISSTLDESRIANARIIQPASLPTISQKSLRKLAALLAFGCFMGLAIGIVLAAALEFLDHSVKTNEDVERQTGLPVLITIPKTRHHKPEPQGGIA